MIIAQKVHAKSNRPKMKARCNYILDEPDGTDRNKTNHEWHLKINALTMIETLGQQAYMSNEMLYQKAIES